MYDHMPCTHSLIFINNKRITKHHEISNQAIEVVIPHFRCTVDKCYKYCLISYIH